MPPPPPASASALTLAQALNSSNANAFLPLSLAARLNMRDVAKRLVELGARPSEKDEACTVLDKNYGLGHHNAFGAKNDSLKDADGFDAVLPHKSKRAGVLRGMLHLYKLRFTPLHFAALTGAVDIVYDFLKWSEALEVEGGEDWGSGAPAAVAQPSAASSRLVRVSSRRGLGAGGAGAGAGDAARPFSEDALVLALSVAIHAGRAGVCNLLLGEGVRVSAVDMDAFGARPLYRALLLCGRDAGRSLRDDAGGAEEARRFLSVASGRAAMEEASLGGGAGAHGTSYGTPAASGAGAGEGGGGAAAAAPAAPGTLGEYGAAERREEEPSPLGVPLPDALRRALVTSIVRRGRAVPRQTTFFAIGVAAALFLAQLFFVFVFTYASSVAPGVEGTALLLYKNHLTAAFSGSLSAAGYATSGGDVGAQPANACTFLGWLTANLCMQRAAAALAAGTASAANFSGPADAATCGPLLARAALLPGCNVSGVAAALGAAGAAVATGAAPFSTSPLLFGSLATGASASRLTQGSSLVVGAIRVSLVVAPRAATGDGNACVPWEAGAGDTALGTPVPAELLPPDGAPSGWGGRGGLARGGAAGGACVAFAPSSRADLFTLDSRVPWFSPVAPEASDALDPYHSILGGSMPADPARAPVRGTSVLLPSDAEGAAGALPALLAAVGDVGLPFLAATRFDVALYQPALDVLAAVRVDTQFPPFDTSVSTVAVRVAPVGGIPASLTQLAAQLALLVFFLMGNMRSYGTSTRFRWWLVDTLIPCLTITIIALRASAWTSHEWLSSGWNPRAAPPEKYHDVWSLLSSVLADTDVSAVVLLLAIFRCVEYLEKSPLGVGITLQSIMNMWLSPRSACAPKSAPLPSLPFFSRARPLCVRSCPDAHTHTKPPIASPPLRPRDDVFYGGAGGGVSRGFCVHVLFLCVAVELLLQPFRWRV